MNVLIHTPVKENGDYCVIDDILSSGQNIHGDHMNVLVAVKNVSDDDEMRVNARVLTANSRQL